jgi:hypothetical protein
LNFFLRYRLNKRKNKILSQAEIERKCADLVQKIESGVNLPPELQRTIPPELEDIDEPSIEEQQVEEQPKSGRGRKAKAIVKPVTKTKASKANVTINPTNGKTSDIVTTIANATSTEPVISAKTKAKAIKALSKKK